MCLFDNLLPRHKKPERQMTPKMHFIDDLYVMAGLTRLRLDSLRANLKVPRIGDMNRKINAFYLGSIEGDLRRYMDVSKVDMDTLVHLVFGVALYTATKERLIKSDEEWGKLASEYEQAYLATENHEYRKLGLGFAGILGADPEENWEKFVEEINRSN